MTSPRENVLLVEDSKDVRNVMAEMISTLGMNVIESADGVDAWRKIAGRTFDLVISDLSMPRMNGEELVKKMRESDIDTPVILISGVDFKKRKLIYGNFSNCSVFQKPFKIEELKREINRFLGGKNILKKRRRS